MLSREEQDDILMRGDEFAAAYAVAVCSLREDLEAMRQRIANLERGLSVGEAQRAEELGRWMARAQGAEAILLPHVDIPFSDVGSPEWLGDAKAQIESDYASRFQELQLRLDAEAQCQRLRETLDAAKRMDFQLTDEMFDALFGEE